MNTTAWVIITINAYLGGGITALCWTAVADYKRAKRTAAQIKDLTR